MNSIAIISDTHVPGRTKKLPSTLLKALSTVDMIIHLGDVDNEHTLNQLKKLAPIEVVKGNHDKDFPNLEYKKVLKIKNIKIGIIHGHKIRLDSLDVKKVAIETFKGEKLDIICFGHSHQPFLIKENNTLYLNPGSPTKSSDYGNGSFCILQLKPFLRVEFVFL